MLPTSPDQRQNDRCRTAARRGRRGPTPTRSPTCIRSRAPRTRRPSKQTGRRSEGGALFGAAASLLRRAKTEPTRSGASIGTRSGRRSPRCFRRAASDGPSTEPKVDGTSCFLPPPRRLDDRARSSSVRGEIRSTNRPLDQRPDPPFSFASVAPPCRSSRRLRASSARRFTSVS